MLVKSKEAQNHVADLEETSAVLRKYRLKLNPRKCTFGVWGDHFLGFMVTQRGIETNPLIIKAILDMNAPANINEVPRLMGNIAALSRFISKAAEKNLLFFKVLRKTKNFEWDASCQQAFEEIKRYLAGLPLLVKPAQGDTLYLYLSSLLKLSALFLFVRKKENKGQFIMSAKYLMEQRAGIVVTSPHGEDLEFTIKFSFKSNNEAEYEALLIGMKMAQEARARHLVAYSDSYSLEDCRTRYITIQYLPKPRAHLAISSAKYWRTPVVKWLEEGSLPGNRWETTRLKTRAVHFLLQGGVLYKNLTNAAYFDVCLNKRDSVSSKKYIADVVELIGEVEY
ncbi:UNVERIFIED_CONTAM: hypothetical protein Sangu_3072800 [Sesamum angustifolium]|uniref:RNase H type-1 domain-containing protein n=1 Tax=Sesamum angustifolium TaxID=2727405 RepID=A0AAW2KE48_9LAMI